MEEGGKRREEERGGKMMKEGRSSLVGGACRMLVGAAMSGGARAKRAWAGLLDIVGRSVLLPLRSGRLSLCPSFAPFSASPVGTVEVSVNFPLSFYAPEPPQPLSSP